MKIEEGFNFINMKHDWQKLLINYSLRFGIHPNSKIGFRFNLELNYVILSNNHIYYLVNKTANHVCIYDSKEFTFQVVPITEEIFKLFFDLFIVREYDNKNIAKYNPKIIDLLHYYWNNCNLHYQGKVYKTGNKEYKDGDEVCLLLNKFDEDWTEDKPQYPFLYVYYKGNYFEKGVELKQLDTTNLLVLKDKEVQITPFIASLFNKVVYD